MSKDEIKEYEISQNEKLKDELAGVKITIKTKLGANGSPFGSITKDEIAKALKEQKGYEIEKKSLECDNIKSLGEHEISVKLTHQIHAKFKIEIVGE